MKPESGNPWEEQWGREYSHALKERLLAPFLRNLEARGAVGQRVVDIGSGYHPVSQFFQERHNVVTVDLAGRQEGYAEPNVEFDVRRLPNDKSFSTQKALLQAAEFLRIDPRTGDKARVDTMLFSDVLNYVDYKEVLRAAAEYLKTGGRMIIFNRPGDGIKRLFSEAGLKDNEELCQFLGEANFEIEEKQMPENNPRGQELLLLAARKLEPRLD